MKLAGEVDGGEVDGEVGEVDGREAHSVAGARGATRGSCGCMQRYLFTMALRTVPK